VPAVSSHTFCPPHR